MQRCTTCDFETDALFCPACGSLADLVIVTDEQADEALAEQPDDWPALPLE